MIASETRFRVSEVTGARMLQSYLRHHGFDKEAADIQDDWCWADIGRYAKSLGSDNAAVRFVTQQLIQEKDVPGFTLMRYCWYIEDREDVWRAMLDRRHVTAWLWYCLQVKDRNEVRQALLEFAGPFTLYQYCRDVSDRDEFRQAIAASGDVYACSDYLRYVGERPEIRAVVDAYEQAHSA